jgi:23S rRNA (uridine2552-2'-O)-methyltransferase
LIEID